MNPNTKLLWMVSADAANTNAQSLNAREIALRIDPEVFESTFFVEDKPDPRLQIHPAIRLVNLPARRRTRTVLKEMLTGKQLITYVDYSPASYIFLHLPRAIRKGALTVVHVEAPMGQLEGASRQLRFLYNGIVPRCDFHTGITDFVVRDMEKAGLHSVATLPVGVDTRRFVSPKKPRESTTPTVLFAGTVIERKGVLLVLEIARSLPQARFLIVGSARGGFDQVVRKRAEELGLKNVQLIGPQSQDQVLQIMQRSSIFLLPSHLEGIPKVTLEAAATGLPCVTFNSYETPSVVHGQSGFQVRSLEEMIECVKLLVEDPGKRLELGAAAVRHAKKFDWDVVAPKWQAAYLQMLGKPARLRPSAAPRL
jgi:glycosyltransferase involved in cell wall biosynthesis